MNKRTADLLFEARMLKDLNRSGYAFLGTAGKVLQSIVLLWHLFAGSWAGRCLASIRKS